MMSSSESSGTSTESDYAEASRTLGKCSSQPLSSTISQAMSDAFVALDDIAVDLKPIALRDSAQGIPRAFDIWKFSLDSRSVHKSVSSYSKLSDATSKQCTYSPSFVPESKERQGTVTTENDDHVSVFKHERLQQKSNGWLSQLPDLPGAELRCVNTLHHDTQRPESTRTAARTSRDMGQQRESTIGKTGIQELLHHMDLFNNCNCGNHAARTLIEESQVVKRDSRPTEEFEPPAQTNLREILDDYHEALLHIQTCSRPSDICTLRYRPSIRRQYPRGLDEEARESTGLITLCNISPR
ncbi:hypothetical protein BFJ63_vAg19501 [Fusarium oxysporum f. sp. narcissi]|uniref:Uncharacterized protein n=1 Tax=Fusarium oxysporum f. sp. narcissi TaxID=451672 RepID=A0A4Q2UTP8_FUSOX|nr:hypothetical protein BFJ63_vAg19501 [Fusarium oxysporum f. sp. narcissi]